MSGVVAQNGTEYALWLERDDGTRLKSLDRAISFEYVKTLNDLGRFSLQLPGDFDLALITKDRRVTIWRKPVGGKMYQDFVGLLTYWRFSDDDQGNTQITIAGAAMNVLLKRRIVAYYAGSAQSQQTDQIDDLMKVIVRQNLGPDATDAARQIATSYFSIAADLTQAGSITKGFAWRNVLEVLKDLSDASRQNGTELYFSVEPVDDTAFEFRTYLNQPGIDRTAGSGQPLILSKGRGNLKNPELSFDYDSEINFSYAGGQGTGVDRVTATAEDTARSGLSVFARSEGFADARNDSAADGVQAAADAKVSEGRPVIHFTAQIVNQAGALYGLDWNVGYRLTADYLDRQFDCLIRSVHVTLASGGLETVEARVEAEL